MTPEISPDVVRQVADQLQDAFNIARKNGEMFMDDDRAVICARAAIAAMPDARAAALEEAARTAEARSKSYHASAEKWGSRSDRHSAHGCETVANDIRALASQPAPALRTPGTSFWRDDALENAAQIVERYPQDVNANVPDMARDIRALKAPVRQEAK